MKYTTLTASVFFGFLLSIRPDFSGEWEYRYSVAKSETLRGNITHPVNKKLLIDTDSLPLGYKLAFSTDRQNKQKDMPETVVKMRKNDPYFKNVIFKAFKKDGKPIDVFYPASHEAYINGAIDFTAYGKYRKEDFILDISKEDTLIITDSRYYSCEGHKYSQAGHIYVKIKKRK
jgi:hypothetical protein